MRTLLAAWLLAASSLAAAQSPAAVTRIVVPFGPGGVQDTLARAVNTELATQLGRTIIVENRAGAGGTVGTASVAKAPADGSAMILAGSNHFISGALYSKLPYDALKDFTGIAHIGTVDSVLIVNADLPVKSVAEFIAHAKANPGKLNYSSAGSGSVAHLAFAHFTDLAGIQVAHIPFKTAGEALQEVLAGRAHAVIAANISAMPYAKEPRVRMLGVTGAKRSRFLPDLPTIAETVPTYAFDSWMGLIGPAATPRATIDQVNGAMAVLLRDPAVLARLNRQGIEPQALPPEAFNDILRADAARMERVVKSSGARIE